MRRIVILLAVVALMVGMLAMSVAPASAVGILTCYSPTGQPTNILASGVHEYKLAGYTHCRGLNAPVA